MKACVENVFFSSPVTYGGSPPTYTNLSSPHAPSHSPMSGGQGMMHPPQNPGRGIPPTGGHGRSPNTNNNRPASSPSNPETATDDSEENVPVNQVRFLLGQLVC